VNNGEVLYEVAFVESFGGDVGWCFGVTNTGTCAKGNTTNQVGLTPSYYMSFADGDQRRDVCCATWMHDNDTIGVNSVTGISIGKWDRALATKELGKESSKGTGINFPLMRYSDVLLMLAEAENELNGPTAVAQNALKAVRARAFAGQANYAEQVDNYVATVSTSKDAFFNAIVDERAWEFGGEGLRRFDLIRWNLYAKKIEEAMRTMLVWGIAQNQDLMMDESVKAAYPDVTKYANWANYLYYKLGPTANNTKSRITWLNTKYKLAEDADVSGWYRLNWGSSMLKRVRTYIYKGTSYTACTKTTDASTGIKTYVLGEGASALTVTVNPDEDSNITRHDEYQASDYATRIYRGYSNGALTGDGIVPFYLPISTTTLNSSEALSNEGYGILANSAGEGINVVVGIVENENY